MWGHPRDHVVENQEAAGSSPAGRVILFKDLADRHFRWAEPVGVVPHRPSQVVGSEVAGELADVAHHGTLVVEVAHRDLDDVVPIVPEPGADLSVTLGGRRVAMEMAAQAVPR